MVLINFPESKYFLKVLRDHTGAELWHQHSDVLVPGVLGEHCAEHGADGGQHQLVPGQRSVSAVDCHVCGAVVATLQIGYHEVKNKI